MLTRHFVGRSGAAADHVVAWCLERWPETLPPGLIFCVPTSLALRRLRDALIERYHAFQGVNFLLPPQLITLFARPETEPVATPSEQLAGWDQVFTWLASADADHAVAEALFPGKRAWLERPRARYAIAQRLTRLRATLVEASLDFTSLAKHPATLALEEGERLRWDALAVLEEKYRAILDAQGVEDPIDRQLRTFRNPEAQSQEAVGMDWRVVMACVPDFMPALEGLLNAAPQCDVLIQAEPAEADRFTEFGLPDPDYWEQAEVATIDIPEESLCPAESPADEAEVLCRYLDRLGTVNPASVCFGVLDAEVMIPLTAALQTRGVTILEPEPLPLASRPAARALQALLVLAGDDRYDHLQSLLALPEVATALQIDLRELRAAFYDFRSKHLPTTLREALKFTEEGPLETFLKQCQAWVDALRSDVLAGARTFLVALYGGQTLDATRDPLPYETFKTLHDLFLELAHMRVKTDLSTALLQTRLNEATLRPVRRDYRCSYEGRMELLWSPAERMLLAGINERIFPDSTFEDAFLPNSFRRDLGIRSDRNRFARDAYLLQTLCGRFDAEHLRITCSRASAKGDWTRPSRLLFRCDPKVRLERAKKFFLQSLERPTILESGTALRFRTNPRFWTDEQVPLRLSASDIAGFLASPLSFWLKKVLGLNTQEQDFNDVMPANDFGTLLHDVLRLLPTLHGTTEDELIEPLLAELSKRLLERYGKNPDVEILVVKADAEARLRSAVTCELALRKEGWKTRYWEGGTKGWSVTLPVLGQEVTLYGRIDRIDYNESLKRWRIIDYKTGGKGTDATLAHYKQSNDTDNPFEWKDFQLPIYRMMARHHLATREPIELAYFSLPLQGDAAISTFIDPPEDPKNAASPPSEMQTQQALQSTLERILQLNDAPIPAELGAYDASLLGTLMEPTLKPEK